MNNAEQQFLNELDYAVAATGVEDVFALAGRDKPNVGLLSGEFLEEVWEMPLRNLAIETAQVIKELIQTAKAFLEAMVCDDALAQNESAVRESVRVRLRILVRQTLRKYEHTPYKTAGAVALVLEQAEGVSSRCMV
ncbi:hypothetical protein CWS43_24555 [Rahnella sp. AA]|nr:hypothetical protein CWS43_24555 [Rahnella sp. AA]